MTIAPLPLPSTKTLPLTPKRASHIELVPPEPEIAAAIASEWQQVVHQFANHRYLEVLALIDNWLEIQPEAPIYWLNKGIVLAALEDYGQALSVTEQALQLSNEQLVEAWHLRGEIFLQLEDYEQAVATYQKITAMFGNDVKAWFQIGGGFLQLEKYLEAIAAYGQSIDLDPECAEAWYNRACAYALHGNHIRAIQDLSQAIALDPSWREKAQAESNFQAISNLDDFQVLVNLSWANSSTDKVDKKTGEIQNHPWMQFAGMYKDDPLFDDLIDRMEAYRKEMNQVEDILES